MPNPKPYTASDGTVTYRVRFRVGERNTSETFAKERDAKEFCADLAARGVGRALKGLEEKTRRGAEPTVGDVFSQFVGWKSSRVRSDRTVSDYRRDWTNWIGPTFDLRTADLVEDTDIQKWVDSMIDGTLTHRGRRAAAKSIVDKHALLHQVFAYAVRRKIVAANPCHGSELPKKVKSNPKGLRPGEWHALYAALKQIDPDAADLAEFLLASGWRWSEATALNTFDVEDDGGRMWVTMDHVVRINAHGQRVIVEEGKGEGSLRRVEIDGDAARMVRERVSRAAPGSLVFTTGISPQNGLGGKQWHYGNFRTRAWDKAVTVANLHRKPTPHWLRHTAVFWLATTGEAQMPELQSRIGHRNIATTIGVYGRMITDVRPEALERFAAMRRPPSFLVSTGDREGDKALGEVVR